MKAVVYNTREWQEGERGPQDLALKLIPTQYRVEVGGYNHQIGRTTAGGKELWFVNRWPADKVMIPPYTELLDDEFHWGFIIPREGTYAKFETAELAAEKLEQLYTSVV